MTTVFLGNDRLVLFNEEGTAEWPEVLAVPGHPFDARASGSNMLIRDGATLVRSARDVIDALSRPEPPVAQASSEPSRQKVAPPPDIRELHRKILDRLGPSPVPEDQLIRDIGGSAGAISSEIASLEIEGRIRRDAGGLLSRVTAA